mmetsp:Transcript_18124/g.42665  ORF Transcript_18124/g.42665 Transcript_18124/m.42665 type:complete len:162 (+) Transcript_18124:75-560(+)
MNLIDADGQHHRSGTLPPHPLLPIPHHPHGTRKRKGKKGKQWVHGEVVPGSQLLEEAISVVGTELGLDVRLLDEPGEVLFGGLTRGPDGELWQDMTTCRSYTSHGIDYDAKDEPALWYDALHPTAAGAEIHFRRLVAALQNRFPEWADESVGFEPFSLLSC